MRCKTSSHSSDLQVLCAESNLRFELLKPSAHSKTWIQKCFFSFSFNLPYGRITCSSSWCLDRDLNYGHWLVKNVYCSFYSDKPNLMPVKYMIFYSDFSELRAWILSRTYRFLLCVVGCQIDVSMTERKYSNGSPTAWGESENDGEASKTRKPRSLGAVVSHKIISN